MNQPKQPEECFNEWLASDSGKSITQLLKLRDLGREQDIIESSLKVAFSCGMRAGLDMLKPS